MENLPNKFLDISDAMPFMESLGYKNAEQVRYAIRKNFYRQEIDFVDCRLPGSSRPTYRINPAKCAEQFIKPAYKRISPHGRGRPPKLRVA
ncbi:hypothetical protein NIES4101_53320 [Calothrix sp. NIES-4101]|nr:hypothetical protein NIES4101_53320 [Calothrix sp. NIES-4101]